MFNIMFNFLSMLISTLLRRLHWPHKDMYTSSSDLFLNSSFHDASLMSIAASPAQYLTSDSGSFSTVLLSSLSWEAEMVSMIIFLLLFKLNILNIER